MSISVQQLVQTAFQNCSLIGDGESVDGTAYGTTAHDGALGLLNNLLSELNNQGYIVSAFSEKEFTYSHPTMILKSENQYISDALVLGVLPDKIEGVSRKVGSRWLPLHSCDLQTMDTRTKMQLPTSWCYELGKNEMWTQQGHQFVENGLLFLDTNRPTVVKFWYRNPIKAELSNSTLFLSDMYFDLLLNGLCVKLCVKYKLTDYLPMFEQQFRQAKNLIKRSNATQRMLQRGDLGGGYDDSFYNGLGGVGW
jgi:hypothetical protein